MSANGHRLSFWEKAGYSLGDAAANFVFMTMILFQLNFYTDTLGLSAAVAGTILLVGRMWDAFFDPLMGVIADRTNTRWGKFRPWVLWTAVPWAVAMFLAFTVPGFGMAGTVVYALLTNMFLMTVYSANNTPYSALTGVMTGSGAERTRLSQYRFVAAMVAQFIVGGLTMPLVAKFGQGNPAKGWQLTMGLWALVCLGCFLVTFLAVRERVVPDPAQKMSVKQDFGDLIKNGPWLAMFILTLAHFTMLSMRGGTGVYFFKYYLDKDALAEFLRGLGLVGTGGGSGVWAWLLNACGLIVKEDLSNVSEVAFSLQNMGSQLVTLIGVFSATWLSLKFGKRAVALAGFLLTTVLVAGFVFIPRDEVLAAYLLEWLRALCYGPTIPLLWAMFADVVDYGEWKTGRRATGVVFATIIFALKFGLSLGGMLAGWVLGLYGFKSGVPQSEQSLLGIKLAVSVYPALCLVVVLVCLWRYRITKQLNQQIERELEARRRGFAAGQSTEK